MNYSIPITSCPIKSLSILNYLIESSTYFFHRCFWIKAMSKYDIDIIQLKSFKRVICSLNNMFSGKDPCSINSISYRICFSIFVPYPSYLLKSLVLTTIYSLGILSFLKALPRASSAKPLAYISAVSKKLIPDSKAFFTIATFSSSSYGW